MLSIPYALLNISLINNKSKGALLSASIVLVVISSFLTYRFLILQEDNLEIKNNRINEVNILKIEIKKLNIEISNREKLNQPVETLLSQRSQFETEMQKKNAVIEQSKDLVHRLYLLNLFVALFGYGVAVNYISKITSEDSVSSNYYTIPKDIYKRLDNIETIIGVLSFLVFLVLVMQVILLIKS